MINRSLRYEERDVFGLRSWTQASDNCQSSVLQRHTPPAFGHHLGTYSYSVLFPISAQLLCPYGMFSAKLTQPGALPFGLRQSRTFVICGVGLPGEKKSASGVCSGAVLFSASHSFNSPRKEAGLARVRANIRRHSVHLVTLAQKRHPAIQPINRPPSTFILR